MSAPSLHHIASDLARSLSSARMRGATAFVTTALCYPNGTGIVLRVDESRDGYVVSDDGYTATIVEGMQAGPAFRRIAADVADRLGVRFEEGTFFVEAPTPGALAGVAVAVANAAARAAERTAYSVEQHRARQSRDLFDARLREAFGASVDFDVTVRGATNREWDFDAGIRANGELTALFALVAPAFSAVAAANMKIIDVRGLDEDIRITAALADYERTEPSLRSILSQAADRVIAANDDAARYRIAG